MHVLALTAKTFFCRSYSSHSSCHLRLAKQGPCGSLSTISQYCHHPNPEAEQPFRRIAQRHPKLQCASPWRHRTSRCRSSRTWHPVVSVSEMCTPSYAPSQLQLQLQSHSHLLTRIADRSENPHGRSRVSPYLSFRKAHFLFSLDSRHPQALERPLLCPLDV